MARIHSTRRIGGSTFILAEKIEDYRTAALAQAEYWAEGLCCRKETIDTGKTPHYNLWVGPERKCKVRLLPGEEIKRERGSRILRVS